MTYIDVNTRSRGTIMKQFTHNLTLLRYFLVTIRSIVDFWSFSLFNSVLTFLISIDGFLFIRVVCAGIKDFIY